MSVAGSFNVPALSPLYCFGVLGQRSEEAASGHKWGQQLLGLAAQAVSSTKAGPTTLSLCEVRSESSLPSISDCRDY